MSVRTHNSFKLLQTSLNWIVGSRDWISNKQPGVSSSFDAGCSFHLRYRLIHSTRRHASPLPNVMFHFQLTSCVNKNQTLLLFYNYLYFHCKYSLLHHYGLLQKCPIRYLEKCKRCLFVYQTLFESECSFFETSTNKYFFSVKSIVNIFVMLVFW